jgi:hypothetical protein
VIQENLYLPLYGLTIFQATILEVNLVNEIASQEPKVVGMTGWMCSHLFQPLPGTSFLSFGPRPFSVTFTAFGSKPLSVILTAFGSKPIPEKRPLGEDRCLRLYLSCSLGEDCIRDIRLPGSIRRKGQRSELNWAWFG